MQAEAARVHRGLTENGTLDEVLRKRLNKGMGIDDQTLAASLAARPQLTTAFLAHVFGNADVIVLPVMPLRTAAAATCDPKSPSFDAKTLYHLSRWTRFVNWLGLPAVAVPVGFDDRAMPVGLQIVGRPHSDLGLIALANVIQSKTTWHARVPTVVSDVAPSADEVS